LAPLARRGEEPHEVAARRLSAPIVRDGEARELDRAREVARPLEVHDELVDRAPERGVDLVALSLEPVGVVTGQQLPPVEPDGALEGMASLELARRGAGADQGRLELAEVRRAGERV